jgi:chaperonin GroEL (HSP60 family)
VSEVKDRVTDALCTLDQLKSNKELSEGELAGIKIIQRAVRIPSKIIAKNAGFEGELIVGTLPLTQRSYYKRRTRQSVSTLPLANTLT